MTAEQHDFTEWSDEKLFKRVGDLQEQLNLGIYSGERLRQLQSLMGHVVREQVARYAESRGEKVAEAWSVLGKVGIRNYQEEKAWEEYERI